MVYKILLGSTVFVHIATWLFAGWRYQLSDAFVPLHYTIYFGFDRFGPRIDLFLFPLISFVIVLTNSIVSHIVLRDQQVWKVIFMSITLLMVLFILLALLLVVLKDLS